MLCIQPLGEDEGVQLTTWADGELISTEAIYTDGVVREAEREGCVGQEDARFSDDGRRVYLKSEYVCEGGTQRGATGLLAFANPMEWLDIKVIEVTGEHVPMVLRYRLARAARVEAAGMTEVVAPRAMSVKAARIGASARLTAHDLIEATGKVDTEAVEALIVERGDPFDPDADMLMMLADAGVEESVIDLAIAVSYPDKFAVNTGAPETIARERTGPYMGYPMGNRGFRSRWSFWDPFYYDPFYYSPYGNGYSPYYYNYGWYSGYYRPTTVIVDSNPTPREHGRVVNGRGYSRGGTRSTSGSNPGTRSTPSARSGGSTRSGSGAMTSSGARSGSTSRSTGRTAKRRGGGGI